MSCSLCNNDDACIERALVFNGDPGDAGGRAVTTAPVPYGEEPMNDGRVPTARCAGCGVTAGNYHHEGCAFEVCPRCGGQLVECPCRPGVVERAGRGVEAD